MIKHKVSIKGTSSYLPSKVVSNLDIQKRIDTTDEWIFSKLGIKERRLAEGETVADMGYKVALQVLENANMSKEDLDMIIVATSSPSQISPSTACIIHEKLQIEKNVPAFDVNAVCSGFVYALTMAGSLIGSGACKNILVIATEAYSKNTNWDDRHCVFFGDGAGAVILSESDEGWIYSELQANGKGTGMTGFRQPLDAPFIMRGKEVWNQAVSVLPDSIRNVLKNTNTLKDEIKMLVPHQPSINILKIQIKIMKDSIFGLRVKF
jgi:3-oxoacyl-[acyl-carrier-protein] synthase-3